MSIAKNKNNNEKIIIQNKVNNNEYLNYANHIRQSLFVLKSSGILQNDWQFLGNFTKMSDLLRHLVNCLKNLSFYKMPEFRKGL